MYLQTLYVAYYDNKNKISWPAGIFMSDATFQKIITIILFYERTNSIMLAYSKTVPQSLKWVVNNFQNYV